jgi:peptidoglycan/LPS O-acetylase OafA/YrhL
LIGGNQLWSVGIEEQFYLIWPWLIRMFIKNIVPFLLVFIGIKMTIHLFLIIAFDFTSYDWLMSIEKLYGLFPVEQMAFGGLGASILFDHKKKLLGIIRHPFTGVLALSSLILLCALDMKIFFHTYLEAVLFLIIIMQVVHHERIYKHLENKWLSHLGKISYGIYMWHTVVIALLLTTIEFTGFSFIDPHYILLVLSPVITIVVAHYSYVFMERPIMSLKLRLNLKKASRGFHVTRP